PFHGADGPLGEAARREGGGPTPRSLRALPGVLGGPARGPGPQRGPVLIRRREAARRPGGVRPGPVRALRRRQEVPWRGRQRISIGRFRRRPRARAAQGARAPRVGGDRLRGRRARRASAVDREEEAAGWTMK